MQIIIGGDIVPTRSNATLFENANIIELLGNNLFSIWNKADLRIFNLEAPIVEKENPIAKCGPNLFIPTSFTKGLKALNPSLIALANNHILDQGIQGLKTTISLLDKNRIPYVGVGDNLMLACKPYIFNQYRKKIGIYACAEHEFSLASTDSPGANPFDPLESFEHIRSMKKDCDYIIVLYHGGKEHYRYPSPNLQKVCRKLADYGANLIICQHSHCIGSYENYKNSTILYGQGNFIFDLLDNEYWQTSLLVKVDIDCDYRIEYIPIFKVGNCIRLGSQKESEQTLKGLHERSKKIKEKSFIEENYKQFAQKHLFYYLNHFAGNGKLLSSIDFKLFQGKLLGKKYNHTKLLEMLNYIECEAHRELILACLKGEIGYGVTY